MKTLLRKVARVAAKTSLLVALIMLASTTASATPINQYATTVLGFSSQYSTNNWGAIQALGAPNIYKYGENPRAWAPRPMDGTLEFISLGFAIPVFAESLTIRETLGNGFVYQVDVIDTHDVWHTVWGGTWGSINQGIDPSPRPTPAWRDDLGIISNFLVDFSDTTYKVDGVKIYTNTSSIASRWEEIDSVTLHGTVPESGTVILLALGLLSLAGYRLRQKRQKP